MLSKYELYKYNYCYLIVIYKLVLIYFKIQVYTVQA